MGITFYPESWPSEPVFWSAPDGVNEGDARSLKMFGRGKKPLPSGYGRTSALIVQAWACYVMSFK